ncbi:hypothetical protein JCM1840_007469 [Sporobolomyces johnsonii]
MLPSLPQEVLEHILDSNVLTNSDLFRCSLVSHAFLEGSRRSLYHWFTFGHLCETDEGQPSLRFSTAGVQLQAIRDAPELAKLVRAIQLPPDGPGTREEDLGNALKEVLELCPGVDWLRFDKMSAELVPAISLATRGRSLRMLEVGDLNIHTWGLLVEHPEIKHIACAGGAMFAGTLPPTDAQLPSFSLTSLSILGFSIFTVFASNHGTLRRTFSDLVHSSRGSLRSLTIPYQLDIVGDLSAFPHLRHLNLSCKTGTSWAALTELFIDMDILGLPDPKTCADELVAFLSTGRSLEMVVLGFDSHTSPITLDELFTHDRLVRALPSVTRIHFTHPDELDMAWLISLVCSPFSSHVREIGLCTKKYDGERRGAMPATAEMVAMARVCETRGVELVEAEKLWFGASLWCFALADY